MNQDEIWAMSLMWESVSFSECSKVTESQAGLLNDRFIVANAQDFFFFRAVTCGVLKTQVSLHLNIF